MGTSNFKSTEMNTVFFIAFVAASNIGLACGACPDGWINMYDIMPELGCLLWERSCSQDLMSWERADAFCKENGAHLVEINSLFQMDMLYTLSGPDGLECYFWAGATDNDVEGEWRWQGSGELVPDEVWNSGLETQTPTACTLTFDYFLL